ncbi:metal-sensing transcriptional repressor [Aminipila butyrica]|uniref:Metal-sensing transcriptional repressor n=1 Tax=Aminipila butyrica TaxID=433296 RepID=A0A858BTF6_9FIRM|nr:metal-sensing transcriptional repressor [Aminipila butyrica]QIB69213.1 metal-sensing transcriptional repressor [Aminipila butyrica]
MKDKNQLQNQIFQADQEEHGHSHTHEEGHSHAHAHPHQNTKAVLNRLSRASGHLEAVRRMVEEGKDCSEVLIQLSAVIAALNNTGKVILSDHITSCIVDAVESGDQTAIENLNKAIDRFIK